MAERIVFHAEHRVRLEPFDPPVVIDAGWGVSDVEIGETVFVGQSHSSEYVVRSDACTVIPEGVDPHPAAFASHRPLLEELHDLRAVRTHG